MITKPIPFAFSAPALGLALMAAVAPLAAQDDGAAETPPPGPSQIVNAAAQEEWVVIAPEDLLVMTLAPDPQGQERKVIIQLLPAPLSAGWTENIRTLARAGWYDGTSINRVQDNYVVQWGDPNYDNPEAGGAPKPLPDGLKTMREGEYVTIQMGWQGISEIGDLAARGAILLGERSVDDPLSPTAQNRQWDIYGDYAGFYSGWPVAFGNPYTSAPEIIVSADIAKQMVQGLDTDTQLFGALREDEAFAARRTASKSLTALWPVHCYGMVGVGRNLSPDTGTGAELYTVIGHAPRHLDRNIALAGRIIAGIEHLSSLPRGSGALGFYSADEASKRTPIQSVRVASDLPEAERPQFEYLATDSGSFARYAYARANRSDEFFISPAGGADICNVPVPVRAFEYDE
jgi:peptidylprolyl isomerase